MDMASITTAYTGLKFIKDALEVALGYKIENETREQIHTALQQAWTIQDMLFKTQGEMFRLQAENEGLRRQLQAKDDWEQQKSQYQLDQTEGRAFVYVFTGTPKHYACTRCFSKHIIQILQDRNAMDGTSECPECQFRYRVKPEKYPRPDHNLEIPRFAY